MLKPDHEFFRTLHNGVFCCVMLALQVPKLSDTTCFATVYPKYNFKGSISHTYTASSSSQIGEYIWMPDNVVDWGMSIKLRGNCETMQVLDEDWLGSQGTGVKTKMETYIKSHGAATLQWKFQPGGMYVYRSIPKLTYGMDGDVGALVLTAAPPHIGQPKPRTDWEKFCYFQTFNDEDYYTQINHHHWDQCPNSVEDAYASGAKIRLTPSEESGIYSFHISSGCRGAILIPNGGYDTNDYKEYWGVFDMSQPDLYNSVNIDGTEYGNYLSQMTKYAVLFPKENRKGERCTPFDIKA